MRALHLMILLAVVLAAAPHVAMAVDVDAVVRAPKPLTVKLGAGTAAAEKKLGIEIGNAASDPAGATFRLVVGDGDCPPGLVNGTPDFGKKSAATHDSIVLLPGKHAKATVRLTIPAAAFTTVAPKVPARCTLAVSAITIDPAGTVDPSPANAIAPLEIDVLDANDPVPPVVAEVVLASMKPLVLTATPGKVVTKTIKVVPTNVSSGNGLGTPDADVTLVTVGGTCPPGITAGVDLDKAPGVQTSAKVHAGKKASGKLTLTIDASAFPPGTKGSPARCVLTLAAQAAANTDVSNDVGRVVVDVIGGTGAAPVPNNLPVASFTIGATGAAFEPVMFDATGSSDPDGDPLTYSWSFGDGGVGGVAKLAHTYAQGTSFTVHLTVTDNRGGSASITHDVAIAAGAVAQGTVPAAGVVRTLAGAALAGVGVVAEGGGTGTTDATGKITINVPRGVPFKFILTKGGFVTQYLPFSLPVGAESAIFEATMLTQEAPTSVNAAIGGSVPGKDGATLVLPPDGLVAGGTGAPITGAVSVAITPVDPVSKPQSFPGRYAGVNTAGDQGLLLSHGTVEFVLTKNGSPVNLAPGSTAVIEIPLYATLDKSGAPIAPGAVIPLWSLDETTGAWVQEGTGVVVASSGSPSGLALRATVGHLSWWNCDAFAFPPYKPKPKCMVDTNADGILEDLTGTGYCWNAGTGPEQPPNILNPIRLPGTGASAVLPRYPAYAAQAEIPAAGGIVLPVPANLDITLRASAKNGTLVGTKILHGAADVEEEVQIKLEPLAFEDATPITLPWDQSYTLTAGAVHQYRFAATAGDEVYVTVTRAIASQLQGTVLVQGPSGYELGPATFKQTPGKLGFFAPATGQYRVVIEGTTGEPAGYRLQVSNSGTIPLIVSTSPLDGASGVAVDTTVSANFTATLDPTSVITTGLTPTFSLLGPLGTVAGTAVANGTTATFTPTAALDPGVAYIARLTTGIRSSAGDPLQALHEWSFTAAGSASITPLAVGTEPVLSIAPSGEVFVIYQQDNNAITKHGTTVSRFVPGEGWQAPVIVKSPGGPNSHHGIATSANGSVVAVWGSPVNQSSFAIFASHYTAADGWSAPEELDAASANLLQARPEVVVDDDGNAIAAWRSGNEIHARRYVPASGWDALDTLFAAANQPLRESVHLAIAVDGHAVAARIQGNQVTVRRFDPLSGWAVTELLGPTGTYSVVRIGIDAADNILLISKSSTGWTWQHYDAGVATWDAPQPLLTDATNGNISPLYDAELIVLPNGNAVAAAQQSDLNFVRVWTMRFDATQETWSNVQPLFTGNTCSFQIASTPNGNVGYGAWVACPGGPPTLAWSKYTSAGGWGSQTVIPEANVNGIGTSPVVQVGTAPDETGLLIYRRNFHADNAILAAKLE